MAVNWQVGYQYALEVDAGDIPACQWVRKACRRFLDDLEQGHERGLIFDTDKASGRAGFLRPRLTHQGRMGRSADHTIALAGVYPDQPVRLALGRHRASTL